MLTILLNTLQQTLIFLPLALGVYLSYDVLMVTDLTVEGTFVLGAAIFARLVTLGCNQMISIFAGLLGGIIVGILVTVMQRLAKINSLIAGILAVFMLYSVNFGVMTRPNISLLKRLGKKPAIYLCIGLSISNMLAALSGIMTAQLNGFADIQMGLGMALTAIGAVVIGKKLVSGLLKSDRFSALIGIIGCFIG